MDDKPHECIAKKQDNGEFRCFICWDLFIRASDIERVEQLPVKPHLAGVRNEKANTN